VTITSIPSTPLSAPASAATPAAAAPTPGPTALAALGAQPAPQPSAQALAVSIATSVAAMRQSALAPLLADLAQAVAMPSLPAPVQQAISQVLAAQTSLDPPPNAAQLQQATASSGVFLEAQLGAGAPPPTGDLKSALLVVQQVLQTWLESAPSSSPALAAPALAALATPPSTASTATTAQAVAATQPSIPATTPPAASSGAPFNGDPNSRQTSSNAPTPTAAPTATAGEVATTPEQVGQPAPANTPSPASPPAIEGQVGASPTAASPDPSPPSPQATGEQITEGQTTGGQTTGGQTTAAPQTAAAQTAATQPTAPQASAATPGAVSQTPPAQQPSVTAQSPATVAQTAANPTQAPVVASPAIGASATPIVVAAPAPPSPAALTAAVPIAALELIGDAEAAPAQASTTPTSPATAPAAAQPPPPPYRGGPTTAQPSASASFPVNADPSAVGVRLLAAASGAVARQQLHQIASLPPDSAPQPGQQTADASSRWMFELPFATATGSTVAQFEISRDGGGGAAAQGDSTWRARFSIDLEPMGPVHAQVAVTGARAGVTLWAERPATAKQLRAQCDILAAGLEDASFAAAVSVQIGVPPHAPPAAGRFLDQAS